MPFVFEQYDWPFSEAPPPASQLLEQYMSTEAAINLLAELIYFRESDLQK